jgi:hypothetical protein
MLAYEPIFPLLITLPLLIDGDGNAVIAGRQLPVAVVAQEIAECPALDAFDDVLRLLARHRREYGTHAAFFTSNQSNHGTRVSVMVPTASTE